MSEKKTNNNTDPGTKKKLKISKEVIEDLKDEDLDQVVGGEAVPPVWYPINDEPGEE